MFCHPNRIKKLPNYEYFVSEIKRINNSNFTDYIKNRDKKRVAKGLGIRLVPLNCDNNCPYKKECDKECAELRKRNYGI